MNILERTRCYMIGPIESADDCGVGWRKICKKSLQDMGVIVFDPTEKPYIKDLDETSDMQKTVKSMRTNKDWDKLTDFMKEIRTYDLALVDKSDFIIFNFDPDKLTCGSWEEFFLANREKKPIFFVCEKGIDRIPLWVFGTIPWKYFYESMNDCLFMLEEINRGNIEIDSNRWRLLAKEHR
jgi:hypothetical protein